MLSTGVSACVPRAGQLSNRPVWTSFPGPDLNPAAVTACRKEGDKIWARQQAPHSQGWGWGKPCSSFWSQGRGLCCVARHLHAWLGLAFAKHFLCHAIILCRPVCFFQPDCELELLWPSFGLGTAKPRGKLMLSRLHSNTCWRWAEPRSGPGEFDCLLVLLAGLWPGPDWAWS